MKAIEIKNLTKYYGKSRGIVDLNLSVEEGDFFGFIGPNGAGKSTTIRTLLGLITPTSGSAAILNQECGVSKTQILRQVGYMPSEAFYYDDMKVKEVMKLAAGLHGKDCSKEASNLCERLQLDTGKKIEQLSLGNRKKVSIVCALQHMPRICILDEPTSGLDPLMQQEFFKILQERNRQGTTIFLSSHILQEIQKYCHSAGIIRKGTLIRCGSVEELSHSNARRVTFTTAKGTESFLYQGEISELLKRLQGVEKEGNVLQDLTITEPTLDEIVMHYYEKESRTDGE